MAGATCRKVYGRPDHVTSYVLSGLELQYSIDSDEISGRERPFPLLARLPTSRAHTHFGAFPRLVMRSTMLSTAFTLALIALVLIGFLQLRGWIREILQLMRDIYGE